MAFATENSAARPANSPTEAQYEYACRAGTDDAHIRMGQMPCGTRTNRWAGEPSRSAKKPLNDWGLGDMKRECVGNGARNWFAPYEAGAAEPTPVQTAANLSGQAAAACCAADRG